MALFKFTGQAQVGSLMETFKFILTELGISVVEEFSNQNQVFAQPSQNEKHLDPSIKIFISWIEKDRRIFGVEVRSDEPQLKDGTYCETIQKKIQEAHQLRFIETTRSIDTIDATNSK